MGYSEMFGALTNVSGGNFMTGWLSPWQALIGLAIDDECEHWNLLSMFGAATIMGIILRGIGAVRLRLVARRSDVSAADLSDLKALNRCTSFMVVGAAMCFGLLAGLTIMFRI